MECSHHCMRDELPMDPGTGALERHAPGRISMWQQNSNDTFWSKRMDEHMFTASHDLYFITFQLVCPVKCFVWGLKRLKFQSSPSFCRSYTTQPDVVTYTACLSALQRRRFLWQQALQFLSQMLGIFCQFTGIFLLGFNMI